MGGVRARARTEMGRACTRSWGEMAGRRQIVLVRGGGEGCREAFWDGGRYGWSEKGRDRDEIFILQSIGDGGGGE